ncbi:Trypanosome variant surface glycoprotein C-terminal domain containing protein [Trypanosoma brucei equiperdum]|uniref:Trypanosome variant surface glycoprotein C-terminal domain containing protein n=1 Tax=Trypanosoma brucei equiperdum TaxID=630700 RepID=A0A3L6LCY1_9TRYP|nr:Trypanosome variant surface glycoprotein C-terminal domain containing protein [Trypanosoma brucei equiperdum]
MMIRLLTAAAFLLHVATRGGHGAVADGDSYADFAALCNLITLAQTPVKAQTDKSEALELLKTIKAINISVASSEIRQALTQAQNKKWAQLSPGQAKGKEGWQNSWDDWVEAKIFSESGTNKEAYKEWTAKAVSKATQQKIVYLTAKAVHTALTLPRLQAKLGMVGAQEAAEKALLGESTAETEFKPSSTDRVRECGKASGGDAAEGGNSAGKALLLDLLCLCGGHANDKSVGKACCKKCSNGGNSDAWELNKDGKARAEFIASNCPKDPGNTGLSTEAVYNAWHRFLARTAIAKGTDGAYRNALGVVHGTGDAGCSENKQGNGGPCVQYSDAAVVTGAAPPDWLTNLRTAAQAWDDANNAISQIKEIENKLQAINNTLGSLLWQDEAPQNMQSTATGPIKVGSDTNCNNHQTNKTCTEKGCKWDSTDKSDGDFCKAKAETQATEAGGAGETPKEGAASTGCPKHGTDKTKCNTDKSFKSEGETFKDSSFLSNKNCL